MTVETETRTEIWVKTLDTGPLTRLFAEGVVSDRPAWSPDGKSVLFVSDRDGTRALYQIPADGSAPAKLMLWNPRAVEEAQWSRDGKWLIYRVGSGGRQDIYVRAASGDSVQRPMVNGDAEEFSPSLSPDGRWLAYGSDESGRFEVYVRPFPNTGAARWQVSREGGLEPLWSGTGGELYYYRNAAGDLIEVAVDGGSGFGIRSQRALFSAAGYWSSVNGHGYSMSPDGKYFYFVKEIPGTPSQMIVVLNWFRELTAKVGK